MSLAKYVYEQKVNSNLRHAKFINYSENQGELVAQREGRGR